MAKMPQQMQQAQQLQEQVMINNKKNNTGTISFEYKDLDQLDKIINSIKNNY